MARCFRDLLPAFRIFVRLGGVFCLVSAVFACAPPRQPSPTADADKALATLQANFSAQVKSCAQQNNYVPLDDAERRLAPNELAYRQCVYQGIEAIIMPTIPYDSVRQSYAQLIAEDKRLTGEVAAGRLTRGERQEQLDAMKQLIKRNYRALEETSIEHQRQDDMERTRAYIQQQRELWQVQQQINDVHTTVMPAFR
ncbi:MAG: hypothetical protein U1F33_09195 [Alphaproteobacteria bacterium]